MDTAVSLKITDTGWITTFQDLGRSDTERLGVTTGGAADQHSASVANILAGNARHATLIESMGGEFAMIPSEDVLVAVTGAPASVTVGNVHVDEWSPLVVPARHELRVRDSRIGTRNYIAINGTMATETFLGSAAPDARMGFAQTIARGSELKVRTDFHGFARRFFDQSLFRLPVPILAFDDGPWVVDIIEGPAAESIPGITQMIAHSAYTVTDRSNHVGLRLNGPVLHPEDDTEIVSHGAPIGALEIPHSDELIVLGRYRSLTAGYPIVGFAARSALSLLGQAGPGRELRFRWISRQAATQQLIDQESRVRLLERLSRAAYGELGVQAERRLPASPLPLEDARGRSE